MVHTFTYLPDKKFLTLEDPSMQHMLRKWSMLGRLSCQAYVFDQEFSGYQLEQFTENFIKSPAVASSLEVWRGHHKEPLGYGARVECVEEVPCSLTSMDVFRRLYETEVVKDDGEIVRCPEQYHHDLVLDDNLKKVLVDEGGELWDVLKEADRQQLLLRLFRLVALGGECCQFEDNIHQYLVVTRALYKDLVTPIIENGRIVVKSKAAQIRVKAACGAWVPEDPTHSQNILLLVVNPHAHTVHVFLHQHGVGDLD
ncbi:cilia- and flagella-associated protein 300-like [Homarus americanus]|uniref:Cilia- and flagella-associated protein 300 n=1 Tax=Homarus americanus TaxID=6706 RepID=A0A8J5K7Z2_HOMAM|nr:cilia- and flagella-associated protein 300-like [Homarus americanus]KAG7168535.1 Cilia- and flagella-associated protein 300-like [Homarus americanus]